MAHFEVRGWEVVAANLSGAAIERLRPVATRITPIGSDRYTIEMPLSHAPDRFVPELAALGATLVSVNPVRETLEEFFVQQIAQAGDARPEPSGSSHAHR
jgi:hypothetical protein